MKPYYADIADLEEDRRIDVIGRTVMDLRKKVTFLTDDEEGKAERYVKKLRERFPGIVIGEKSPGPVGKTVAVKVSPPDVG